MNQAIRGLFKMFEYENGARKSDEKLPIDELQYLQNERDSVKSTLKLRKPII